MTLPFGDPVQGTVLKPEDVHGHLLLVRPIEHVNEVSTSFGVKDGIRCDVADLTSGEVTQGVLWLSGYLVGALKASIGGLVLGHMAKGEAKPGQSPPWVLKGASSDPASATAATNFLATPAGQKFQGISAPTTPASAVV